MQENSQFVRLQKFLSQQGICSRREAEDLIRAGKILINGRKAELGQRVEGTEKIEIAGRAVRPKNQAQIVIAFHKPLGVESTLAKKKGAKTLADFDFGLRVFPIGRLDKNSRGLLLLTNDGELGNRLAHPRYEHEKEYEVTVDKSLPPAVLRRLSSGEIVLSGKKVQPCKVSKIDSQKFGIILREGRNRQIRRMCDEVGLTARDLFRIRVGTIGIGNLKPGAFRALSEAERKVLADSTL